jgi:hypothetical protein
MAYRIAKSLDTLRRQINEKYPQRSKASDGWIGDTAHSARASDHNPNEAGVVCAFDVTNDPANGCNAQDLAETLRTNRDPRLAYVISNSQIFSSTVSPWVWRPYNGANKHNKHCHISVKQSAALYDDPSPWALERRIVPAPTPEPPVVPSPPRDIPDWLIDGARQIISWETARDANGKVAVHQPSDGSFEVAGINSNSHLELASKLRDLVKAGRADEAEREASKFIVEYTNPVAEWVDDPGVEFYLRDCWFNRGARGAANILQRAVGVTVDEDVGEKTLAAIKALAPMDVLLRLRKAREAYELAKYGRREQYWDGLEKRWDRALLVAQKLVQTKPRAPEPDHEPKVPIPAPPPITGAHDLRWVQQALNSLGATPLLEVDGSYGDKTKRMLEIFQTENGLMVTGLPDASTILEIEKHLQAPTQPAVPSPYVSPLVLPDVATPRKSFWDKLLGR